MIKVHDIAYVRYAHHDLEKQRRFLIDFGLVPIEGGGGKRLYRATGEGVPCYIDTQTDSRQPAGLRAIGFLVPDRNMLELASERPDCVAQIKTLPEAFGGGECVTLRDPVGLHVELIHGSRQLEALELQEPLAFNHSSAKLRYGKGQRPAYGAAAVHRLGHAALLSGSVPERATWYQEALGMLLSDALQEEERVVAMFMRCDRGDEWTDHHTVAVFESASGDMVHHVSFEVPDLDSMAVGSRWLERAGWQGEWGIGRHVLGSQIFDYWRDSDGCRIEHFSDGDVFKSDKAAEYHPASADMLYQWGPQVPQEWLP